MTEALLQGESKQCPKREEAPRLQPEGPINFSTPDLGYSALPRPLQVENTIRVAPGAKVIRPEWRIFERRSPTAKIVAWVRREQITAVLRDRNNGPCVTDDAILFLEEVLPHIAIACGPSTIEFVVEEWVGLHAPRLTQAQVVEAITRILSNPPRYTSVEIGRRLNVTEDEWLRLPLSHIRPAGWTRAILKAQVTKRRTASRKAARQASGETKTPRELSITRLEPWTLPDAPCSSRQGFYRLSKGEQAALVEQARRLVR